MIRADGALSPVKAAATYDGIEYQITPTQRSYLYYGASYFSRNTSLEGGHLIGFGVNNGASAANKLIQELTLGYFRTLWSNPYYGALLYGAEASFISRTPWGGTPHTSGDVVFLYLNLRYILP